MAKRREPIKPIFPLKHEFYASLDHLLQQIIMLHQSVEQAIDLGLVKDGPAKEMLAERSKAVREAMSSDQ